MAELGSKVQDLDSSPGRLGEAYPLMVGQTIGPGYVGRAKGGSV